MKTLGVETMIRTDSKCKNTILSPMMNKGFFICLLSYLEFLFFCFVFMLYSLDSWFKTSNYFSFWCEILILIYL